jgi:RNA polymerase sigma factor (sigma-70 family)
MAEDEAKWQQDLILAGEVLAGNESSLQSLYEQNANALYAFIFHSLDGEHDLADDIWQETWLAGFHSLGAYSGRSSLFTWLCAIARHKMADHFRRAKRTEEFSGELLTENTCYLDAEPLPEQVVQAKATRLMVVRTFKCLSLEYQSVLEERYLQEKSVGEIARQMQKSYKATESLLSRARNRFRQVFNSQTGEQDEA